MKLNRLFSVAPMMGWTDRHDRYFLRLISPHALLYTEMITAAALIYGDYERFLKHHPAEYPLALQLGGNDPSMLGKGAKYGENFGFSEINLNVGCPSDRVKAGKFGACLMLEPSLVKECVASMVTAVKVPVSVKCRIGVDLEDSYDALANFISEVHAAGCNIFIIHARKAWLKGLNPKQNREIPPLQYETVVRIKKDFPQLTIIMNGGINTLAAVEQHLQNVDGVMIGREAYHNPFFLSELEEKYFNQALPTRFEIINKFIPYIEEQLKNEIKLSSMTRHILGLFQGQKGAKVWRRTLSEKVSEQYFNINLIHEAVKKMRDLQNVL
jgi:tRNA-dihydrouridine synthase A